MLAALSRIEELDFDHEACDVTARNMCFTCVESECESEEEIKKKEVCLHFSALSCAGAAGMRHTFVINRLLGDWISFSSVNVSKVNCKQKLREPKLKKSTQKLLESVTHSAVKEHLKKKDEPPVCHHGDSRNETGQ